MLGLEEEEDCILQLVAEVDSRVLPRGLLHLSRQVAEVMSASSSSLYIGRSELFLMVESSLLIGPSQS